MKAKWGAFSGNAAPLDVYDETTGPIPKEQLKKLWDIYTHDMGKTPVEILAMPEFIEAGIECPTQLEEL